MQEIFFSTYDCETQMSRYVYTMSWENKHSTRTETQKKSRKLRRNKIKEVGKNDALFSLLLSVPFQREFTEALLSWELSAWIALYLKKIANRQRILISIC